MDYSEIFLEMLQFLQLTYRKFPKFMIEIMAENYGIPLQEIKPLMNKFRKEGILLPKNKSTQISQARRDYQGVSH